jgi:hypothetical protein
VPLSANKVAAGQMYAELVKRAELRKFEIGDPFEEHRKRPLADHLDACVTGLQTRTVGFRKPCHWQPVAPIRPRS